MQPWGSINFLGFQATHCGLFRRKIGENYRIFGRFFAENDQSAPKICRLGLYSRWGCIHADTVIALSHLLGLAMICKFQLLKKFEVNTVLTGPTLKKSQLFRFLGQEIVNPKLVVSLDSKS